jgi:hypothetical protein
MPYSSDLAHELHQDAVPQTSDLLDIAPFLWTVAHNLRGFQPTVIEQIGESLLPPVGKSRL